MCLGTYRFVLPDGLNTYDARISLGFHGGNQIVMGGAKSVFLNNYNTKSDLMYMIERVASNGLETQKHRMGN